jgi:hypothetical protein
LDYTVAVLLYGDYPELAKRCLDSLIALPEHCKAHMQLRIKAVQAGTATAEYLDSTFGCDSPHGFDSWIIKHADDNPGKYVQMRRMLCSHNPDICLNKTDTVLDVRTPYVMWFDDDSYIQTPTQEWYDELTAQMAEYTLVGDLRSNPLLGNQLEWIKAQHWYQGLPVPRNRSDRYIVPTFAVGGWWCVHSNALFNLDWPTSDVKHLGGDYMLGEALRQNGYSMGKWFKGVVINDSPRRGIQEGPACGEDYTPTCTRVLHDATSSVLDAEI